MLQIIKDTFNLLTFRITRETILDFGWQHFIFGLICTWIVGIGRYWDNPRAEFFQKLGIGSIIYVFVLSFFLWLIILLLLAKNWTYFRVLTFILLVSPPAILYAIPVQFWFELGTANNINSVFLLVVAAWRVLLLLFFLRNFAELNWFSIISASVFAMTLLICVLASLNLERVVFDFMRGVTEPSPNDTAYEILNAISFLSILVFPFALISYLIAMVMSIFGKNKSVI
jgi:hypothetical protein